MLDGGEIKVFAPFSDQAVDNFEDSGHRKFNPTFGELMAVKAFHKYGVARDSNVLDHPFVGDGGCKEWFEYCTYASGAIGGTGRAERQVRVSNIGSHIRKCSVVVELFHSGHKGTYYLFRIHGYFFFSSVAGKSWSVRNMEKNPNAMAAMTTRDASPVWPYICGARPVAVLSNKRAPMLAT